MIYLYDAASWMDLVTVQSSTLLRNDVIQLLGQEEDQPQWKVWFGECYGLSIIADGPSIGSGEDAHVFKATRSR